MPQSDSEAAVFDPNALYFALIPDSAGRVWYVWQVLPVWYVPPALGERHQRPFFIMADNSGSIGGENQDSEKRMTIQMHR